VGELSAGWPALARTKDGKTFQFEPSMYINRETMLPDGDPRGRTIRVDPLPPRLLAEWREVASLAESGAWLDRSGRGHARDGGEMVDLLGPGITRFAVNQLFACAQYEEGYVACTGETKAAPGLRRMF